MTDAAVLAIIRHFTIHLEDQGVHVSRVILFGSRSTGTEEDGSDLDIAVISPDFTGRDLFERVRLIKDAISDTIHTYHIPMDVIPITPAEYENESSPRMTFIRGGIEMPTALMR